jgi:hypothetical protein
MHAVRAGRRDPERALRGRTACMILLPVLSTSARPPGPAVHSPSPVITEPARGDRTLDSCRTTPTFRRSSPVATPAWPGSARPRSTDAWWAGTGNDCGAGTSRSPIWMTALRTADGVPKSWRCFARIGDISCSAMRQPHARMAPPASAGRMGSLGVHGTGASGSPVRSSEDPRRATCRGSGRADGASGGDVSGTDRRGLCTHAAAARRTGDRGCSPAPPSLHAGRARRRLRHDAGMAGNSTGSTHRRSRRR